MGPRRGFDGTEWNCVKCNQINYRQNKVCYRCGVNKALADYEVMNAENSLASKQKVMAYIHSLNEKHKKSEEAEKVEDKTENTVEDKKEKKRKKSRSRSRKRDRSRSYSRE